MFWADRIAQDIEKRFGKSASLLIRDEKTVSGRVHVGSMRGVAIHGVVSEALADIGIQNTFKYELNDFDPMDDIPTYLPREKFEQYLGKPLRDIPSPDPSAKNFAEYFANDFTSVIAGSGFTPEYVWSSELYLSGKMDGTIREALEAADTVRRIYKEVSGSERPPGWLPINVICPQCGKITTTDASDFDGETVMVHCIVNKAPYTKGCDFKGRVSPFGGLAKLAWKVDWPAKWKVHGVNVEGGGKDHSTRGGSRDVGNHISREVFKYEPPFDIPYEFFLVGGKKMSSSKGRGSSAKEIAELLPPKIFRLALLGKDINQAFNFDPEGDSIPVLYDQYDKLAAGYWAGTKDDYARLFEFIHPLSARSNLAESRFLPRFSQVAFIVQMPHLNVEEEVANLKGAPLTPEDKTELQERATYAKKWLEAYAPEKYVFKLQEETPEAARELTEQQRTALAVFADYIEGEQKLSGEQLHHRLHEIKDEQKILPGELFGALYLIFLGKHQGPQAGWFLASLPRDFVLKRLREAVG
ncbi:lysine--tRNA ligase [Candidatus Adlerbacteria bacterium RIFCSPLOWO2_01_FULL_51_16]|uniref:Lysine--tRNA ligase n=1 Tax=Candidatus Adlerbacteria bacterium RIFCSPLOWO2_01_FULL_51_16 TaxID=1797243 RepID=A0A1F4XEK8_9BACT|nr:MAG: lysine--tRNA ligase [Candidatus Adlerbacteria bacterium RIFCSPLOWO2_01_FULL_51_16]